MPLGTVSRGVDKLQTSRDHEGTPVVFRDDAKLQDSLSPPVDAWAVKFALDCAVLHVPWRESDDDNDCGNTAQHETDISAVSGDSDSGATLSPPQ